MTKTFDSSSLRGPDLITEELVKVLSGNSSFEFQPLFDIVHSNVCARKPSNGSDEMMRLRTYDKLQSLIQQGMVKKTITKTGKRYKGIARLASFPPPIPFNPSIMPTHPKKKVKLLKKQFVAAKPMKTPTTTKITADGFTRINESTIRKVYK